MKKWIYEILAVILAAILLVTPICALNDDVDIDVGEVSITFADACNYLGTAARIANGKTPQALRFKFEISKNIFNLYKADGYELSEYGTIAVKKDYLEGNNLIITDDMYINGKKVYKGKAYDRYDGTDIRFSETSNTIQYTSALFNIGVRDKNAVVYDDYDMSYAVRPYAIYENGKGEKITVYDDTQYAGVFDVTDAVVASSTASDYVRKYGKTSAEYAKLLSDIYNVRQILKKSEVKEAYAKTERTDYVDNTNVRGVLIGTDIPENFSIHTELQNNYLNDSYSNIAKYAQGDAELSRPNAIAFRCSNNISNAGTLLGYVLSVSNNQDMSNAKLIAIEKPSYNYYNSFIGEKYYWNIAAVYSDCAFCTVTDDFSVEDKLPRNIYIDGVTNCRDMGGWTNANGKRIKQGLLYRSARIENATTTGKKTFFDELGIKSEIDLRMESEIVNAFKDKLNYYPCCMGYDGNILKINTESIIKAFKVLGDEKNYPLDFHCSIGTDRTGMMACVMGALLGATPEQLYRDYLFSNFGNINGKRTESTITSYLNIFNKKSGDTLSQKVYNYLVDVGVSSTDIDNFIKIMTEN